MFQSISATGSGVYVTLVVVVLSFVFKAFGIIVPDESIADFALNTFGAIGFVLTVYGQFRRKDLVGGIVRKI